MFQIGEKFGDYEVIQILGAGGMGQVYKVRNVLSDRCEAMKVLLPNLAQHSDLADRFLREIKVQATLQHKNIAGLHTAQRQGDRILMFIEFVDGITLDKGLQQGPLSPELAANIVGQVLEALAYAHERGVVHRDIKPENIMVRPDGTVKLMDFGIARLAQDRRLTGTGHTVGSLFYMSPEQIRGAEDLDNRSDLYSLGITLYQAVTGKRPFDGDSDYSIMSAHISQIPPPPVQLDPNVPEALNDVIMMAIAKDRNARYQSAEAFRSALLGSVGGGIAVPAPSGAPRMATTPIVTPAPTVAMEPPPPVYVPPPAPAAVRKGGSKTAGWVRAGLMVVILSVVAFLWTRELPTAPPPVTETKSEARPASTPAKEPDSPVVAVKPASEPAKQQQEPARIVKSTETKPAVSVAKTDPEPTVAAAPPTQPPIRNSYRIVDPKPAATAPAEPRVDPQAAREMEELRQKFNSLASRFAAAQESIKGIEAQQARQGLGMRRDVREGAQRVQYLMKESADSLTARNMDAARTSLNMAERGVERLEKFLGN